jgi:hypothetical protein
MSQGSNNFQYPTAIDQFITWEDDIDNILASAVNNLHARIIATQTELGTDPAGSLTDVKTRLAVSIENDGTLKADTVGTSQISTGAVDTDELAADAVDDTKIADNAIGNEHLQDNAVDTAEIADDAVGEAEIDLGSGANQVDHNTLGFQKKTITVSASNGEYAFDFTDESLLDYSSAAYQVFFSVNPVNDATHTDDQADCWATVNRFYYCT